MRSCRPEQRHRVLQRDGGLRRREGYSRDDRESLGAAADPVNIRIILDTVNHPYCEATPDFCNWEYEHMLFSGLKVLAPYAHTNCHAKYWDRWTNNDVQRAVRIMLAAGYKGRSRSSTRTVPGTASTAPGISSKKSWRRCRRPSRSSDGVCAAPRSRRSMELRSEGIMTSMRGRSRNPLTGDVLIVENDAHERPRDPALVLSVAVGALSQPPRPTRRRSDERHPWGLAHAGDRRGLSRLRPIFSGWSKRSTISVRHCQRELRSDLDRAGQARDATEAAGTAGSPVCCSWCTSIRRRA